MSMAKDHWLYRVPFAHRGMHNAQDAPQNTLQAFQLAVAHGYGIELDVRLSRDGEAMVFHDKMLEDLSNGRGPITGKTAAELGQLSICNTPQTIPTLAQVLALVAGKVPLLVEIKGRRGKADVLDTAVAEALDSYQGEFALLAFDPWRLQWFAQHRPQMLRGQNLSHGQDSSPDSDAFNLKTQPDFVSYDIDILDERCKKHHKPVISWTIDTPERLTTARLYADNIIFEKINLAAPCCAISSD